jgi:hypothetical protein
MIRKMGDHEDPWRTFTAADYVKRWTSEIGNPRQVRNRVS